MTIEASRDIERLIDIMAALRTPGSGCPWDLDQTFETIAPYTIEEAYEVADAIQRGDRVDLVDELGDLLLQVVFHARMAQEEHSFDFGDVVEAITAKLIRRHPHVFGSKQIDGADAVKVSWEDIKAEERALRAARHKQSQMQQEPASVLDGVPHALPALQRAEKLQKRAARVGFDWPSTDQVLAKIEEEIAEVGSAKTDDERTEEVGDLLFAVANLARHLKIDGEQALRHANGKFERRFRAVEAAAVEDGLEVGEAGLDRLEVYWRRIKARE